VSARAKRVRVPPFLSDCRNEERWIPAASSSAAAAFPCVSPAQSPRVRVPEPVDRQSVPGPSHALHRQHGRPHSGTHCTLHPDADSHAAPGRGVCGWRWLGVAAGFAVCLRFRVETSEVNWRAGSFFLVADHAPVFVCWCASGVQDTFNVSRACLLLCRLEKAWWPAETGPVLLAVCVCLQRLRVLPARLLLRAVQ
jgi:hypothetical protein